jgi:hypothetical protein
MDFWSWDCVVLVVIEMVMGVTGIVLNLMVVSTVRSHEKLQVGGGGHAVHCVHSSLLVQLCQKDEETTEEKAKCRLYRMLTIE